MSKKPKSNAGKRRYTVVFYWRRFIADALAWVAAISLAVLVRFDGIAGSMPWSAAGRLMVVAILLQLFWGTAFSLYRGRHPWGSFEGFIDVIATVAVTSTLLWIGTIVWPATAGVPRSLVPIAAPFAIVLMAGTRYLGRMTKQKSVKPSPEGTPVLIYGAGYVGDHVTRLLTTDAKSSLYPVGILDDDPEKKYLHLHGVKMMGTLEDLEEVAEETGAKSVIVAVGNPGPELLERVRTLATSANLDVLVMPPTEQMLREGVHVSDLRDLDIEDLLGRPQVDTDVSAIAGYLNGKTVLVTGAGGSIGQQLCVEIDKHGPAELIMLDRDETGLQETEIRVRGNGLLDSDEVLLADIRDRENLIEVFKERKPDVVFHAAALKHLPMLEQYPDEAWKTNVLGTVNVLDASRAAGVETLINISTDKAANPTSVLGLSKRLAERLTAGVGEEAGLRYLSVRFGNVIGSRGSMLPTFRRLIEEGKPVTVTHPDITRYFMTIPEACQLVLQAGAIGRVGEVLILDMGEPVRILDIAQKMIALSGKNVEIKFTGMREGEKLHEDLHSDSEVGETPFHKKISHAAVVGLPVEDLVLSDWQSLAETSPNERVDFAQAWETARLRGSAVIEDA